VSNVSNVRRRMMKEDFTVGDKVSDTLASPGKASDVYEGAYVSG
jgi:hypothetical protein